MKIITFKALLFLSLLVSFSCDPAKRIQRICKEHPEVCKQDTIRKIVDVEFKAPGFKKDTSVTRDYSDTTVIHDTIYLVVNNVIAKSHYNPVTKRHYLSAEALPQTFKFKHTIDIVNREVTFKKDWWDRLNNIFSFIGGVVFMWPILITLIRKIKTNKQNEA